MSFTDLFYSGTHKRNLAHFASMVTLAAEDGVVTKKEEQLLKIFARRLNIEEVDYNKIVKDPSKYPIMPTNSADKRLERLMDLFKMMLIDKEIAEEELKLIRRYAIALGFTEEHADRIIKRSIDIFNGEISLDEYKYLLERA
ncbi:hypothetical protein [Aureitalea marina]|uniref:TerB family tellurite resistance protein n=1 Tax=Aureitalea marina TaxID=930804 RepID=A0A2S7KRM1_9FLAO|nr:hypothetical protein [Aureitalea marina]PQB05274.1 hypothetical protein BST85_10545 [Aureitalea marina]